MPIEPHLFLSYGRPDKELALYIASELWSNKIECYNYLAKPIMEHYGTDSDHLKYLLGTRFFIAILSGDTLWRKLVVAEILDTYRFNQERLREIPMVYVTTEEILNAGPYPTSANDHIIDPTLTGGVPEIVKELIRLMGTKLVARCQEAWEVNKKLYVEAWRELDAKLNAVVETTAVALPNATVVMDREVRSRWLEEFIESDLKMFNSDENRWIFFLLLAPILEHAGREMGAELRHLVPRLVLLGHQSPIVRVSLRSKVEPKTYREGEKINDAGSVLPALRRIQKALNWMRCDEALDIAQRFTWVATRRLLLCAIYYCAAGMADEVTGRKISEELELCR